MHSTMQICARSNLSRQLRRNPTGSRCGGKRCPRLVCAVSNKLVLKPTGDGSCAHLGETVPMPGPVELKSGVFEVGRAEPADIIIAVPTVSSRHALLRVEDDKVSITDLNSTNGTIINGQELTAMKAVEVPVGGEIIFGDGYLAKFQLVQEQPTA